MGTHLIPHAVDMQAFQAFLANPDQATLKRIARERAEEFGWDDSDGDDSPMAPAAILARCQQAIATGLAEPESAGELLYSLLNYKGLRGSDQLTDALDAEALQAAAEELARSSSPAAAPLRAIVPDADASSHLFLSPEEARALAALLETNGLDPAALDARQRAYLVRRKREKAPRDPREEALARAAEALRELITLLRQPLKCGWAICFLWT